MMCSKKLCLLWQNQTTRQWYHVANLSLTEKGFYSFSYENEKEKRGLNEALDNGYHLHPSFPIKEKTYISAKLFSTFSRRLPNKSRQDYFHLLELNNLKNDSDEFQILTTTGGRLVSDNYEFVQPIRLEGNKFSVSFYIRGWRHWNNMDKVIHNLKDVYLEVDPSNQQDENAVAVKENGCTIGFIPAFYSEFIKNVLVNNMEFSIENIEFDEKASAHYKLKISVTGEVTENLLKGKELKLLVTV